MKLHIQNVQSKTVSDCPASVWFLTKWSCHYKSNSWLVSLRNPGGILVSFLALHSSTCWFFQSLTRWSLQSSHDETFYCLVLRSSRRAFPPRLRATVTDLKTLSLWLCWRHLKNLDVEVWKRDVFLQLLLSYVKNVLLGPHRQVQICDDARQERRDLSLFHRFPCRRIAHKQGRRGHEVKAFFFFG